MKRRVSTPKFQADRSQSGDNTTPAAAYYGPALTAPVGCEFVPAFNAIRAGLIERGWRPPTSCQEKAPLSTVRQSDFTALRSALLSMMSYYIDVDKISVNGATTIEEAMPTLNKTWNVDPATGYTRGLLLVPGSYTVPRGPNVYTTNSNFGSKVPLLREHIDDMVALMNKMKVMLRISGSYHVTASHSKLDDGDVMVSTLNRDEFGNSVGMSVYRLYHSPKSETPYEYHIERMYYVYHYKGKLPALISASNTYPVPALNSVKMYHFLVDRVTEQGETRMQNPRFAVSNHAVNKSLIGSDEYYEGPSWDWGFQPLPATPVCQGTCPQWSHGVENKYAYERGTAFLYEYDIQPVSAGVDSALSDNGDNGVAAVGCNVFSCNGNGAQCDKDPKTLLLKAIREKFGSVGIPLGLSSGVNSGLQIGHYLTLCNFSGGSVWHYNCNTSIVAQYSGTDTTLGCRWAFTEIQRPSGATVAPHWNFDSAGNKTEAEGAGFKLSYVTEGNQSYYRADFNDGVSHLFRGGLTCLYETDEGEALTETPPGDNVAITSLSEGGVSYRQWVSGAVTVRLPMDQMSGQVSGRILIKASGDADWSGLESIDETIDWEEENPAEFTAVAVARDIFNLPNCPFPAGMREKLTVSQNLTTTGPTGSVTGRLYEMASADRATRLNVYRLPEELGEMTLRLTGDYVTATGNDAAGRATRILCHYVSEYGQSKTTWEEQTRSPKGWIKTADIANYGAADERRTTYVYDWDTTSATYGKLLLRTAYDGQWQAYDYDGLGRVIKDRSPFKNSTPADADDLNRVTTYSYEPVSDDDVTRPADSRPRMVVETVLGLEMSRVYHIYGELFHREIVAKTAGAAWNAANNLVTESIAYPLNDTVAPGRAWKVLYPDGRRQITEYQKSGGGMIVTETTGAVNASGSVIDGTRVITTRNAQGWTTRRQEIDVASNLTLRDDQYALDQYGRITQTTHLDDSTSSAEYINCGPILETDEDGVETAYTYDAGRRVATRSRDGITEAYEYDADGRVIVTTIQGSGGLTQESSRCYSADGLLLSETDAADRTTTYSYAQSGSVWQVIQTRPDGKTVVSRYYADRTIYSVSGTGAHVRYHIYGKSGVRLYHGERGTANTAYLYSYEIFNHLKDLERTKGNVYTYFDHDACNRLRRIRGADGVHTLIAYNARGEAYRQAVDMNRSNAIELSGTDRVTDTLNDVVTLEGRVCRHQKTLIYPTLNSATPVTNQERWQSVDGLWSRESAFGRLTTMVTVRQGGGAKQVIQTNPDGSTVTESYENSRLIERSHSVLGSTFYFYDGLNRVSEERHTEGGVQRSTTYSYDAAGRVLSETQTAGSQSRETSYQYDALGRRTQTTLPGNRVIHYEYAATGELTKQYGDDTYPVSYEYDADGRMTKLTTYRNYPQPGDSTAFAYDADDRIAMRTDAAGQATSYSYDGGGRLLSRTWANGVVTTYSYDNGGTLTGVNYSDDTAAITMTLTRLGETATLTDAAGTRSFTYNADRTVATESQPLLTNGELVYSYDALGRPTGLTLKQGTAVELAAAYTYDAMSRLAMVTGLGHTATYSRVSGSNRLASTEFKVGTTTVHTATRGYDHFNRLTGVNGYGYTYNARDQRTKQTLIDGQSWEYSYDEPGQVISGVKKTAAGAAVSGQNYAYAYDTVGNRETATANAVATNYTANQLNQYTAIGSVSPTYDVNGNLLTGYNGWTMEWNGENRLKAIYNATARLEFLYDSQGRRFSKKTYAKSGGNWVLSGEKKFIYDGFKQIAEYSGTTLTQAYIWQPAGSGDFDVPLWMKAGSNVYTYVTDGNKNIRQLKNAAGTVVASYDYDPFGNVSATGSVSSNPWQFSSEFRDTETGLIYYNYRYYAPTIGRWISRDPMNDNSFSVSITMFKYTISSMLSISNNYQINKSSIKGQLNSPGFSYVFCKNTPLNSVDSYGLLDSVTSWHRACTKRQTADLRCACHCVYSVEDEKCINKCKSCEKLKTAKERCKCVCSFFEEPTQKKCKKACDCLK